MEPPSLAEQDQLIVPDVATSVAPLDGEGDDGVVGLEVLAVMVIGFV